MSLICPADEVLDSRPKVAILRVLASGKDLRMGGSAIARATGYSVPSTHDALKALHAVNSVVMEMIGNQHVYSLNHKDRFVQKVVLPMFKVESNWKEDVAEKITQGMKNAGVKTMVVSVILYGSVQKGNAGPKSDLDVAIIVRKLSDQASVKDVFLGALATRLKEYFGISLDAYIKTADEFRSLLKQNNPPVSTLIKAYTVLYGKEPLEI